MTDVELNTRMGEEKNSLFQEEKAKKYDSETEDKNRNAKTVAE
jgi:hypothetical protein